MANSNNTPTVILDPQDYLYASCADPRRTDFRAAPVIALDRTATTKPRKSSSYADRNRRFFALDANDAVASHLMGVK